MHAQDGPEATANRAAAEAVARLRAGRDEILRDLGALPDGDLRHPAPWSNITRNVQFLLRVLSLHEIDHLQHAQRLLRDRGHHLGEAALILAKAQALRGEMEALLLALPDDVFEANGPDGAWSMRQLVDHLTENDARYLRDARQSVQAGRAAPA